ncbi:MAG: hypothetical protein IJS50_03705, partial [Desulfovibrio sp.]|nr:hypothetical protein [Desulfovibrio sp.]
THLTRSTFRPLLLTKGVYEASLVGLKDGVPTVFEDLSALPLNLPFELRKSFVNEEMVYSLGGHLNQPHWFVLVESQASLLKDELSVRARKIYGLGFLGSLVLALIITILIGIFLVRHKNLEEQRAIGGLVHAIECALDGADAKFQYLQGRSQKVARLSARLGKQLKMSRQSMETMKLAARLSQVGKIFVPREIMIKRGLLTEEERRLVQLAPYHAYHVLKGVLPGKVARIVYQMGGKVVDDPKTGANHELLVQEMLPEARVLLVANDFCAMVSQRGTRPPLPMPEARKKLSERALYDQKVVAAINSLSDEEISELLSPTALSDVRQV